MIQKILALLQNSIAFIVVTLLVTILLTYIFRKSYLRYVVLVIVGEGILAYVVGVSKALFGTTFLIFNTLVLLGYLLFVLRWLGRKLKRPMDQMARRIERLASGNLVLERDESSTRRRDEFGTLNRNFFAMVELMSSPVRNAVAASSSVVEASEQFKVQAGAIAQGASSQAASAEEISSAIEEMAANISQNLDNTKTGAVIGGQVNERLGSVSKAFEETEVSMQHIQARITAIGDIANKTNILAINAAIEAARAGELGKGFAVVAGEVRRLADQSAKLAEEIQRMSNQSANAVDTMGATLRETIPSIQKIVGIVQEIAAASGEQKSGTEQISAALATLAHVTNENASTSNALNESADRLVELSEDLQGSMKVFQIE